MTAPVDGPPQGLPDGRHRRRGGSPAALARVTAVAAGAAVLGYGGVAAGLRGTDDTACPGGPRTLDVVAAPEITPVLAEVARLLAESTGGSCRRTTVRAGEPAQVAEALGDPTADPPDVWIPDASSWAPAGAGAEDGARDGADVAAPSVARSPVVLAVRRGTARRLGSDPGPAGIAALLAAGTPVRLDLPDPGRSAAAAAAVAALQAATDRATLTGALRASRTGVPSAADELLRRLGGDAAVPVTEQAVRTRGGAGVTAIPLGGPALDYPLLVLADPARADAERLLDALRSDAGRAVVRAHGFREPAAGGALTRPAVESATRTLEAVRLGSRMLTVIDVSGSMGERVPGTPGARRIDLTRAAAELGLGLYPADSEIGLWVFSTDLGPDADHRELVPLAPLGGSARDRLARALAGLRHILGGGTGLYDTTLAAVRAVRAGWDPGRVNSVVLLSDGRDDDPHGIGLDELLTTLRRDDAGRRPVPVITIAFGADSDTDALAAISRATGGSSYVARDPREIRRVFLDAVGRRPCRPDC